MGRNQQIDEKRDRKGIGILVGIETECAETRMESKVTAVEEKVGRKLVTTIG